MMHDAQVVLAGFVASEPAFKLLAGGTSTATLRVAYTPRRLNRESGEWGDGPTSFVTVQCWRTLADNVAVSLRKGEPVLVQGRLRVRPYDDREGTPRIAVEVDASSIGHDLTRGVAHFSRTRRAPGETAAESGAAETGAAETGAAETGAAETRAAQSQPDGADPAGREAAGRKAPRRKAPGQAGGSAADAAEGVNGSGVLDDGAVAEFAREMNESLGEVPA